MTAPTGTEATTARIEEVLADVLATDDARHEITDYMQAHARGHTSSNSTHYFYCDGNCASRAALTWVTRYLRDHVAAALSAGVIRDMQAAAWDRCFRYYGLGATDSENPYRAASIEEQQ